MKFENNILSFMSSNSVLENYVSNLDSEKIKNLSEFSFYDLLDSEYLVNILKRRKNNFDDTNVEYFHLSECIEKLSGNLKLKFKWISIKFGITYIVFIMYEDQHVFDFFGFYPKVKNN